MTELNVWGFCAGTPLVPYVGPVPGSSSFYYAVVDWTADTDLAGPVQV